MRFETIEDLKREEEIVKLISKGNYKKLGKNDIDFLIPGKAYIEIKTAKCKSTTPKHYLISLIKLNKMQYYNSILPTYLFIKFFDKLMYIKTMDVKGFIEVNGRKERKGATFDKELMVHVNKELFKEYKALNNTTQ